MRRAVLGRLRSLLEHLVRDVGACDRGQHARLGTHVPGDRARRDREILHRAATRRADHDVRPRRQCRARTGHPRPDGALLVVADPHTAGQARHEADEPRVHVVVHRAGLPGRGRGEPARACRVSGAVVHHALQHRRHHRGGAFGEHFDRARRVLLEHVAVLVLDLEHEQRIVADAAVGIDAVGRGELEQRDLAGAQRE